MLAANCEAIVGWLRDKILEAGHKSADNFASFLLEPARWPSGIEKLHARSLGNNLRALDQGRRIRWWRQRPGLLMALAAAIHQDPEEVSRRLFVRQDERADQQIPERAPLSSFGGLRALELQREALPPGIPELVQRPARWEHCWWTTGDNISAVLVGRWLAARGLGEFISATSWEEASARLPAQGRAFVHLPLLDGSNSFAELPAGRELDDVQICVAASAPWGGGAIIPRPGAYFPWSERRESPRASDWREVATADTEIWLCELVAWALTRLPKKRRPTPEDVLGAIRSSRAQRFFAGPGDALDFIDTLLAFKKRDRHGADLGGWVRARIDLEIRQADDPQTALIREHAAAIMTGLVGRLLHEDAAPWCRGWTRSRWTSRLPRDQLPESNVPKTRALVLYGDDGLGPDEVRKLKRALHPRPGEVIDALLSARLLIRAADGKRLRLPRSWYLEAQYELAFCAVINSGEPTRVGVLARRPHLAEAVLVHLFEELNNGREHALERLLSVGTEDLKDPNAVAACELGIMAVGLALLANVRVSVDLVCRAWDLRHDVFVGDHRGRLFMAVPLRSPGESVTLVGRPVLALALLSLGNAIQPEVLGSREGELLINNASSALDAVVNAIDHPHIMTGVFTLGAVIARTYVDAAIYDRLLHHELLVPVSVYESIRAWRDDSNRGDDTKEELTLSTSPLDPDSLIHGLEVVAPQAGFDLEALLNSLWEFWVHVEDVEVVAPTRWLSSAPSAAERLWRGGSVPSKAPFFRRFVNRREVPGPVARALDSEGWLAWIEVGIKTAPDEFAASIEFQSFWNTIPLPVLKSYFEIHRPRHDTARVAIECAWRRIPEQMIEQVRVLPLERAAHLVTNAPVSVDDRLLSVIATRTGELRPHGEAAGLVTEWIQRVIVRRPGDTKQLMTLRGLFTQPLEVALRDEV
ncbi:MAG: hypothetical protein H6713_22130 [Myxococcales bacterium]|nr:hypothetical protein [Myxococcales bacterium]MCB9752662.1 hypothetical protein [Myxococcales bacterium]